MRANEQPYLVREFLKKTGWPPPRDPDIARRMQVALLFFRQRLNGWCDRPLDQTDRGYRVHGFNPSQDTARGKPTKLTGAMQAINFHFEVRLTQLDENHKLRRYGRPAEGKGASVSGLWFTEWWVPAAKLALPPDQNFAYNSVVSAKNGILVLESTAGDLLVDWNMQANASVVPENGRDYFYRSGGGVQFTIPSAESVLRPV
ncbi:MAG: hypothetical protein JSR77_02130 [Planctomycetes bacterium]|nr:hypothetical protein [Planctomycetota bacterium]